MQRVPPFMCKVGCPLPCLPGWGGRDPGAACSCSFMEDAACIAYLLKPCSSVSFGLQAQATHTLQDVDVEPGNPNLFWSAGEDGTCRQFDARSRSSALLCYLF